MAERLMDVAGVTDELGQLDKAALRACLEQMLSEALKADVGVVEMSVQLSPYASTYAAHVITVVLANGEELRIFRKDFSSYRSGKDQLADRRDREWRVYRDLLSGAGLGTATYYGVLRDASLNRLWLFLEFVPSQPLRYYEFNWWVGAAAWLGRMHGYFSVRTDMLLGASFLARHDEHFFLEMADRAVATVSQLSSRQAAKLAPVLSNYDAIVQQMTRGQPTLVHSVHRSDQIMLDIEAKPPRYCPIDWELAAVGDGAYDLACLLDGVEPPRLYQMFDVYREAARREGFEPPANDELRHVVDCIQVHRAMNWLARAIERSYSQEHTIELVDLARERAAGVL